MYEHRRERLLPRPKFVRRILLHALVALAPVMLTLAAGVVGYHVLAGVPWIDALLNASMILGGMGPVDRLETAGAKVFASAYALFCGLLFIGVMGILLAPFLHRLFHSLHIESADRDQ
jgi:hypothetical protein